MESVVTKTDHEVVGHEDEVRIRRDLHGPHTTVRNRKRRPLQKSAEATRAVAEVLAPGRLLQQSLDEATREAFDRGVKSEVESRHTGGPDAAWAPGGGSR